MEKVTKTGANLLRPIHMSCLFRPPEEIHVYVQAKWKKPGDSGVALVFLGVQLLPVIYAKPVFAGMQGTSHAATLCGLLWAFEILHDKRWQQSKSKFTFWLSDDQSMQVLKYHRKLAA